MKTLRVNLIGREYDILIEKNLLAKTGELIRKRFSPNKVFVVTDETVDALYGKTVLDSLCAQGFDTKLVSLPAGEETKCLAELSRLYSEALSFSITRKDMIIALGGGVIGDLTGFLAATLLRGIPFVQIPTTLLAQVDSSVGGKVAIDVPEGKNLVGAFYQPKLVIIDTEVLNTLSDRIFFDGLAEVIKYGLIADKDLFEKLEACDSRSELSEWIDEMVYTCCDIKRAVVEEDELDTGKRMILNFGHTLAHVAEKEYQYKTYTHGQAVAFGMVAISAIGEKLSLMPQGIRERIRNMVLKFNLPDHIELSNEVEKTLTLDKKNEGEQLNLVLLSEIGCARVHKIPLCGFVKQLS